LIHLYFTFIVHDANRINRRVTAGRRSSATRLGGRRKGGA
jgi:hypothetical protein